MLDFYKVLDVVNLTFLLVLFGAIHIVNYRIFYILFQLKQGPLKIHLICGFFINNFSTKSEDYTRKHSCYVLTKGCSER